MERSGVDEPIVYPDDYYPANFNASGRKIFNLYLASHYGYHSPPTKRDPRDIPQLNLSRVQQKEDQECSIVGRKQVDYDDESLSLIEDFQATAGAAALADPKVVKTIQKWRRCMLPLGIGDLPSRPDDMPSTSQHKRFFPGYSNAPTTLPPPSKASPEEIREAVFDAKCRNSSGYSQTYYQTEIDKQLELMDKNTGALARALASKQRQMAQITKVLQNAGD